MIRCRLRKAHKLRTRADFLRVKKGNRLVGRLLCIDWVRGAKGTRFGITASKHYGDSPERNRFKRLIREVMRTSRSQIPSDLEMNILPRKAAKGVSCSEIRSEIIALCSKIS